MVYAFECERCRIRVYSASPKRARGCPLCAEPMDVAPVLERGSDEVPQAVDPLDLTGPSTAPPP